jgi:hypothetical protein
MPTKSELLPLTEVDRAALQRALDEARREPSCAEQLSEMLTDRPWEEVAKLAAFGCQCKALRLQPWEIPPCEITDADISREHLEAQTMVRRLIKAGLSRWEPDPEGALRRAKERSNHSEPQPSKPPPEPNTREGYARDK